MLEKRSALAAPMETLEYSTTNMSADHTGSCVASSDSVPWADIAPGAMNRMTRAAKNKTAIPVRQSTDDVIAMCWILLVLKHLNWEVFPGCGLFLT